MKFGIKKLSLIGRGARIVCFLICFMKTCGYTQLLLIGGVSVSVCTRHFQLVLQQVLPFINIILW